MLSMNKLRTHNLKENAMGFCTGQIQDSAGNCVFSGAIQSKEVAERIVAIVNLHDDLVKLLEHLKFEAKYSRDDGRCIDELLTKAGDLP
jgi:hypothetical protein